MNVNEGKIALYAIGNSSAYVDVVFKDETFWMTQKAIAEIFEVSIQNIGQHIKCVLDDEELSAPATIIDLLKNGRSFGRDYFDELLEKIREIRASERHAYQKIVDVFEQCSYDYDKNSELIKDFYAFVQIKLHYAVTGKQQLNLFAKQVTLEHPTMGLTTWKDAPKGKVLRKDKCTAVRN